MVIPFALHLLNLLKGDFRCVPIRSTSLADGLFLAVIRAMTQCIAKLSKPGFHDARPASVATLWPGALTRVRRTSDREGGRTVKLVPTGKVFVPRHLGI